MADNLIIKYGMDGHAYIDKQAASKDDFDEICGRLASKLGLEKIPINSE